MVFQPPTLAKKERALLISHVKKSGTLLIRQRAHAVILATDGYSVPEIAGILFVQEKTVRAWMRTFADERVSSIFPRYTGNTNASKLTREQLAEIKKVLKKPPSDTALPAAFWSVAHIRKYLSATYGVVYESDRSYHHLLAVSDLSFKLPEGFDRRRNEELVKRRMREIRRDVERYRGLGYTIFAADECSLSFETEYHRAWIRKGEKTLLKVNRDKRRQNYFGALNLDTHRHELVPLDWQNTQTIIGALEELSQRYLNHKLCVVWDNARWHRAKDLRALLGTGKKFAHIQLLWMPPYAPDHNPEEHVWKIGKEAVGNQCATTFDEVTTLFEAAVTSRTFDYTIR